ncbi:potassium channel family protein [Nakamurella flava]|nr:potassium channel family protein [Nakamurella flava]
MGERDGVSAGDPAGGRPDGFVRATGWTVARLCVTVTGLLLAYLLLPTRGETGTSDVPWVILALVVYAGVAGWQIPAILRSRWPMLRAIEALTVIVTLFLVLFARLYLSNSLGDPAAFSEPLNHVRALYFTITVFATVGFGDITPQSDGMRILVSVQMLLNLVVLGLLLRLITGAVQRGRARRSQERPSGPDGPAPADAP